MGELVGVEVEVPGDLDVELSARASRLATLPISARTVAGRDPGFAVEEPGDPLRERPLSVTHSAPMVSPRIFSTARCQPVGGASRERRDMGVDQVSDLIEPRAGDALRQRDGEPLVLRD